MGEGGSSYYGHNFVHTAPQAVCQHLLVVVLCFTCSMYVQFVVCTVSLCKNMFGRLQFHELPKSYRLESHHQVTYRIFNGTRLQYNWNAKSKHTHDVRGQHEEEPNDASTTSQTHQAQDVTSHQLTPLPRVNT